MRYWGLLGSAILFGGGYGAGLVTGVNFPDLFRGGDQRVNPNLEYATVDCDNFASINDAIARGETYIGFTGSCEEDVVTIGLPRLRLFGLSPNVENNHVNSLTVNGPTAIGLRNFESNDIALRRGVTGEARRVRVVDGALAVLFGSNMDLFGIDVTGTVNIEHNSWARLQNDDDDEPSSIVGLPGDQSLQIHQHSSGVIAGDTTIGHLESEDDALIIGNGSRGLMNNGAVSGGVTVARASSFEVRGGTITAGTSPNAMIAASHSLLTIRPSGSYIGNIDISGDSALMNELADLVNVEGAISCGDRESSVSGQIDATGGIAPACTDF